MIASEDNDAVVLESVDLDSIQFINARMYYNFFFFLIFKFYGILILDEFN